MTLHVPLESWKVLVETLRLDARSAAFDPQLRQRIQQALSSVEVVAQPDDPLVALRRVFDALYVETDEQGRKLCDPGKSWDADTLEAIAEAVRPFFPELESAQAEEDTEDGVNARDSR